MGMEILGVVLDNIRELFLTYMLYICGDFYLSFYIPLEITQ